MYIIQQEQFEQQVPVVLMTDGKYIYFRIFVRVSSFSDKSGLMKNVYEDMRFLESFKIMPWSLVKPDSLSPKQINQLRQSIQYAQDSVTD